MFSNIIQSNSVRNYSRGELIEIVKNAASEIIINTRTDVFISKCKEIFLVVENIRTFNLSLSHEIYLTFLNELKYPTFQDVNDHENYTQFIKTQNFTELYYNIGKLKWDSGDYDNSLYYLVKADEEHGKHTNSNNGKFIKYLLQSKEYVLWNLIPFIASDYHNYRRILPCLENKEIEKLFSIDNIFELLNGVSPQILFQIINSVNRFHNFKGLESNGYQVVREAHTLGELAWIYDCYLKDKYNIRDGDLYNSITGHLLKNSKIINKKFTELAKITSRKSHSEKIQAINKLVSEIRLEKEYEIIIAKSLLISNIVRNYTAHFIDHEFYRTTEKCYNKELYLIILVCFLFSSAQFVD